MLLQHASHSVAMRGEKKGLGATNHGSSPGDGHSASSAGCVLLTAAHGIYLHTQALFSISAASAAGLCTQAKFRPMQILKSRNIPIRHREYHILLIVWHVAIKRVETSMVQLLRAVLFESPASRATSAACDM